MYRDLGGGEEEAVESGREVEVIVQEKPREGREWGRGRKGGRGLSPNHYWGDSLQSSPCPWEKVTDMCFDAP